MSIPSLDYNLLLPHILLAGAGIVVLIFDLFLPADKKSFNQVIALLSLGVALFFTLSILWSEPRASTMLNGDGFAVFFIFIFITAGILVILTADQYLVRNKINLGEFYALMIFAICGMSLMAAAADLIVLFLGLEVMSISLYVLTGIQRERLKSNEAALKYFLLGAFFSGFFLLGVVFLLVAGNSTNLASLTASSLDITPFFLLGSVLILIAFGFKASLFPFHFWSPDVYDGAPTPISAFMATGAKAAAFSALLRVFWGFLPDLGLNAQNILWVIAVVTMTLGNVLALAQYNIKRMLAYSSIAHAGYLLVGFIALSSSSIEAMMFYLFAYTMMNVGAFTVAFIINVRGEGSYQISDFMGAGTKNPFLAVVMGIFLFSLAGIPPTAGFFGKFYLFKSALDQGYIYLVVIAVLNSALSVYYYLRILVIMFMQKEEQPLPAVRWTLPVSLSILICATGILYFGLFPKTLLVLINSANLF